jgi:heat shock protein HslJ
MVAPGGRPTSVAVPGQRKGLPAEGGARRAFVSNRTDMGVYGQASRAGRAIAPAASDIDSQARGTRPVIRLARIEDNNTRGRMSRRTTSGPGRHPRTRFTGTLLALLVSIGVALPAAVGAQEDTNFEQAVEQRWQLLTYRDADGSIQSAPAGVGATVQLFAGDAFGEAACSTYDGTYTFRPPESLFIDPPAIERFPCDPASEAFDEAFYQNLTDTVSARVSGSIMTLRDNVGEDLMTLTRAVIEKDPTVARWELARIGAADGSIEPVIQGVDPWIEFLRGGRLVGDTGCGSFLGSYQANDGTMRISDVAYRLDGCSTESIRRQAEQMVAAFDAITDFDVLPAGMALRDEAGTTRLALAPTIDLGGRTWTPVAVYDELGETPFERLRFSTSTVRFQGPSADGRSICRFFKGDSLSSGLALSTADLVLEKGRCNKRTGQTDIEAMFLSALGSTASQALRGSELELRDVDGFTRMRLLPQTELVGTTWVVTGLNPNYLKGKTTERAPVPGTTLTATFLGSPLEIVRGDTGASDRSGPNTYSADYRTPGASRITIEEFEIQAGRACAGKRATSPACVQETLYLELLQYADSYITPEGELKLLQGSTPLLWFEPEEMVAPASETTAP